MLLTVVEVPVPLVVAPPGLAVKVHVPVAGNPLISKLPVVTAQVGCVMVPMVGAAGITGAGLITTDPDEGETQPSLLVTVKV